jgi:Flp pilus assembly protein TadG
VACKFHKDWSFAMKIRSLSQKISNDKGSVVVVFALAAIPLIGLAGFSIDYSRASSLRTNIQDKADSAALRAVLQPNMTDAQRKSFAQTTFEDSVSSLPLANLVVTTTSVNGVVKIQANANSPNKFMKFTGDYIPVSALAEAVVGATSSGANIEVALVLDTTGSMEDDMQALRNSATTFVNSVMTSSSVKMSVVPYVASVNVGVNNLQSWMIDQDGKSKWHAAFLREGWVAQMAACTGGSGGGGHPGGGGGGGGGGGLGSGGTESGNADHIDIFKNLHHFALELFGVKSANADMMNTVAPITGTQYTPGPPYVTNGSKAFVPDGFFVHPPFDRCRLFSPSYVSNYDLHQRVRNSSWKGCVEARPEPYDVTDENPSTSNVDTLYAPYFYPDEIDKHQPWWVYNNSYLYDIPSPNVLTGWEGWSMRNSHNLLRYDNVSVVAADNSSMNMKKITNVPPYTFGPNRACPDALLPLTSNKSDVLGKINSLNHYFGGGTISSEGLAWGWRTISPNYPFQSGSTYNSGTKKFMVLMTDGVNELVENNKGGDQAEIASEYTAYGYLREPEGSFKVSNWFVAGRFPKMNFQEATKHLDDKLKAVCTNAKAKGIEIYTVMFKINNTTAKTLLESCATKKENAFSVGNEAQLTAAFQSIAGKIQSGATGARLTK